MAKQYSDNDELDDVTITKSTVGRAAAWSYAAEILAKLIVPVTNMILARLLTPEAFGVVATINMVVAFSDIFSTTGIATYVIQVEQDSKLDLPKCANVAFWANLMLSVSFWVAIVIARYPIASIIGNVGYENALVLAALAIPINALSCIQEALFRRSLNYRILFIRRIAVALLPFFVTIPLALSGLSYWSLIIGSLASGILKAVLLTATSSWTPRPYFSFSVLKQMVPFCSWMVLSALAAWGITYIDVFLASNYLGEYYTGLYKNSQMTVVGILSVVSGAISSIVFASLSRTQDDEDRFRDLLISFQEYVGMLLFPLGVGLFCFSDLVTRILLGTQWMEGSFFIGIWGICTAFSMIITDFCRDAYKAKGRPELAFAASLAYLVVLIPICLVSVQFGFECLAYARSFSLFAFVLIHFIITKITLQLSPKVVLFHLKEPCFCSVAMGVFAVLLLQFCNGNYGLQFACAIVCAVLYFVLLSRSETYRDKMRWMFQKAKKRFDRD